jgi:molybdenum cofactor cytidylyltransferase
MAERSVRLTLAGSGATFACHNAVMTVAAVILAASTDSALGEVEGLPRVRRLADVAWSGGAVPICVIAPDADGKVRDALLGAPVSYVEPAQDTAGPVGQIAKGIDAAFTEVRDSDAAIVWPARLQWVDAETITSLIEAHGQHPGFVLRPTFEGEPGWPVLIPAAEVARLRAFAATRMPDELLEDLFDAGAMEWRIDLGDPGTTHDASVAREDLPAYVGPQRPASGHHEWGAAEAAAAAAVDPLEGPSLAPFGQASESEDPAFEADAARLEP